MDTRTMRLLTLCLAYVAFCAAENDTQSEISSLHLKRKDSTPNSLLVTWQLPEEYEVGSFDTKTQKEGSDSEIVGPRVNGPITEYEIPDLMTNSKYEVCMVMTLVPVNASSGLENEIVRDCAVMKTPPAIRADSLIVLFCVIGYLLLMVLLGYLCWRRAMKQHEPEEEEEEPEPIEEKIENGDRRPFLLNSPPPATERPRSRIEEEDIPFITPTWDQIAKEKK